MLQLISRHRDLDHSSLGIWLFLWPESQLQAYQEVFLKVWSFNDLHQHESQMLVKIEETKICRSMATGLLTPATVQCCFWIKISNIYFSHCLNFLAFFPSAFCGHGFSLSSYLPRCWGQSKQTKQNKNTQKTKNPEAEKIGDHQRYLCRCSAEPSPPELKRFKKIVIRELKGNCYSNYLFDQGTSLLKTFQGLLNRTHRTCTIGPLTELPSAPPTLHHTLNCSYTVCLQSWGPRVLSHLWDAPPSAGPSPTASEPHGPTSSSDTTLASISFERLCWPPWLKLGAFSMRPSTLWGVLSQC